MKQVKKEITQKKKKKHILYSNEHTHSHSHTHAHTYIHIPTPTFYVALFKYQRVIRVYKGMSKWSITYYIQMKHCQQQHYEEETKTIVKQ